MAKNNPDAFDEILTDLLEAEDLIHEVNSQ
jgi:hypothetical protein